MKQRYEIQTTADGSATIYLPEIDEHYHSVRGALAESEHIYRDLAFMHRCVPGEVRVLEVGFGTGLNALVTMRAVPPGTRVHYRTLELYPLDADAIAALDFGVAVAPLHAAPWGSPVEITPNFVLEKMQCDFLTADLGSGWDVVYLDSFAPEKQPAMWSEEALRRLVDAMAPGAVLTTYCAKGAIRRLLASLSLCVERLPGPPGGKREVLRATKPRPIPPV